MTGCKGAFSRWQASRLTMEMAGRAKNADLSGMTVTRISARVFNRMADLGGVGRYLQGKSTLVPGHCLTNRTLMLCVSSISAKCSKNAVEL